MSRETNQARAIAVHAGVKWLGHKADCPRCARAGHAGGRGAGPCKNGAPLYLAYLAANKELAHQRELDRQPAPGQEPFSDQTRAGGTYPGRHPQHEPETRTQEDDLMTTRIATPEEIAQVDAHANQWWLSVLTFGVIPKPEPIPEPELEAGQ